MTQIERSWQYGYRSRESNAYISPGRLISSFRYGEFTRGQETYQNAYMLHFAEDAAEDTKDFAILKRFLRVAASDYLAFLRELQTPLLLDVDYLFGLTNLRLSRFATRHLGFEYTSERAAQRKSSIEIGATPQQLIEKIPEIEKLVIRHQ